MCTIQCRKKGYDVVLENTQILPSGENLLVLRTVHNISCIISSIFYPEVDALNCVRSCNKVCLLFISSICRVEFAISLAFGSFHKFPFAKVHLAIKWFHLMRFNHQRKDVDC